MDVVCSTQWNGGREIVCGAKRSNQWMQYAVDAVSNGIVVYGGEDIVFGAKMSNQWTQYAVCSIQWNSAIWYWGHCLWCKRVKPVDTVDAVDAACSTHIPLFYCVYCVYCILPPDFSSRGDPCTVRFHVWQRGLGPEVGGSSYSEVLSTMGNAHMESP